MELDPIKYEYKQEKENKKMVDSVATSQAEQIHNVIEKIIEHHKSQVKIFQTYARSFEGYCANNQKTIGEQDPAMAPGVPGYDIWKLLVAINQYCYGLQAACAQLNKNTRELKPRELYVYPNSDLSPETLASILEADLAG